MEIKAKFARAAILYPHGVNHLAVDLIPPPQPSAAGRKPNLIVFCRDRSGSMAEEAVSLTAGNGGLPPRRFSHEYASKMKYVNDATIRFLDLLGPEDLLGLVSFDSMATLDLPLTRITPANIAQIRKNIRRTEPGSTTNISDGLLTARKTITPEHIAAYNCKVILLSDGIANNGTTGADGLASIALSFLNSGVTVSSLGVGVEYNAATMGAIARSGGGIYHHIEDLGRLDAIFTEEFALTAGVAAKQVRLRVSLPSLIEVGLNLNDYPQTVHAGSIEVYLGDIAGPRRVIFEIRNDFVAEDCIFNLQASSTAPDGRQVSADLTLPLPTVRSEAELAAAALDSEIVQAALSLIRDRGIVAASASYDSGDVAQASASLGQLVGAIQNFSACYTVDAPVQADVLADIDEVTSSYNSRRASRAFAKEKYAAANRRQRK